MPLAIFPLSFISASIFEEELAYLKELNNVRIDKSFNKYVFLP